MPWTTGAPVTQSWGTNAATTKTYSAGAVSRVAWGQVRPQPGTDDPYGQDFEFQFGSAYPMVFSADRPLYFASSLSEGTP